VWQINSVRLGKPEKSQFLRFKHETFRNVNLGQARPFKLELKSPYAAYKLSIVSDFDLLSWSTKIAALTLSPRKFNARSL
jgi:hypothetical protein